MTFPPGIGLPGRAWSKKQPVWIQDVTADPYYLRAQIAREAGLKAGIAFPITTDNEVIGVIVFYDLKTKEKDERIIKLVLTVLSQIGSIVKRKQAEESLRESEEKMRSILDNTTAVVYIKDVQGRFLFINRQFEKLFRLTRDAVKGKTDLDLWPKEMAEAFQANDRRVIESKTPIEFEEVAPHDDGPHTYISVKFHSLTPPELSMQSVGFQRTLPSVSRWRISLGYYITPSSKAPYQLLLQIHMATSSTLIRRSHD